MGAGVIVSEPSSLAKLRFPGYVDIALAEHDFKNLLPPFLV